MEAFLKVLSTAWQGFRRNGWLSFVSVFMMMQALLLISLFVSLNILVTSTIKSINERIDVAVFFKDFATDENILAFKDKIKNIAGIKEIQFVSRDQALAAYLSYNKDNKDLVDVIGNDSSFLPASLEIKVNNPYLIESVMAEVAANDTDQTILETSLQKNQAVIDQLRKINRIVAIGNVVVSSLFIILALLIIFNTIRITIFTRREEIEIMKLVGATDWYIRWPFIVEGILYGVFGALLAFGLTMLGQGALLSGFGSQYLAFDIGSIGGNVFGVWFAIKMLALQLLTGVVVGGTSSYFSARKHLQ